MAGRSWVRVPAIANFFSYYEFFLSLSFLPVDSAKKRVYTAGKRWLILFPARKNVSQYRRRTGMGGLRERNLVM